MSEHRLITPAPFEPSAWLRGQVGEVIAALDAGGMSACPHHVENPSALVQVIPLWETPLRVLCSECARADDPTSSACDRCGEFAELLTPWALMNFGASIVVGFALCADCQRCEVAA